MRLSAVQLILLFIAVSLVMPSQFSIACDTTQECNTKVSQNYICENSVCENPSLRSFSFRSFLGYIALFVIAGIANAGGIGGGVILAALFLFIFGFSISDSVPMSIVAIFAGAVMNYVIIANERHEYDQNSLRIDYQLLSKMVPTLIAGTVIGVMANKLLPPVVILALLIYFLLDKIFDIYRSIKKQQAIEQSQVA